jgi:hypothetical protein
VDVAPVAQNEKTVAGETFTVNSPNVVFDTDEMLAARPATPVTASGQPWWMTRNDRRLNVQAPPYHSGYSALWIDTFDQQRTVNGRVRDHYRRTARSATWQSAGW